MAASKGGSETQRVSVWSEPQKPHPGTYVEVLVSSSGVMGHRCVAQLVVHPSVASRVAWMCVP